jgi:hypothetical protein
MNWLFEQVEEAIIVEDDCLPDSTFFQFCEENLERYRNDPRVFQIAGTNHLIPPCDEKTSYGFSKYASIWGWASWRRAWKNYDPELLLWRNADTNRKKSILKEMKLAWMEQVYWARKFDKILAGHDTWDYQWVFACLKNQGLSIVPRINLISNIGFGPEATHTTTVGTQSEYPIGPTKFPMVHPSSVSASASYDRAYLRRSIVERVMIPLKKFKILERR